MSWLSWRPRARLTNRFFAGRSAVYKPQQFADRPNLRSRHATAALADRVENRRFLLAGHQKCDTPATLKRGVGHCDANLGASVGDDGDPMLALTQRWLSRQ